MKTKIFSSALSLAVAGAFWACNDDSVITIASAEQGAGVEASSSSKTKDDKSAKSSSSEDVIVVHKSSASNATDPSSSADVLGSESGNPNPNVASSSSVELIIIGGPSSSSVTVIDDPVASSASVVVPVTGLGSCAPVKNPINKGESVQWRFSGNLNSGFSAIEFAKAHYDWAFTANAVPQVSSGPTSAAVTYVTSGVESAALKVTMPNGAEEVIMCSPLQVNGDPITGCQCNPAASTIDYLQNSVASWTVTGCTTASLPLAYEWGADVASSENVAAYTFTAAGEKSTSVTVHNSDNTAIKVECPVVRATEGPEYVFSSNGPDGAIKLPAGESKAVLNVSNFYLEYLSCQVSRSDSPTGAISGYVNGVAFKGSDYVSVGLPSGTLKEGAVLTFDLDVPLTCFVP